MSAHRAKSTGDYLWKRMIRIVPVYIIALLFSQILSRGCNHFADLPTPYIINGCVWTLYYEIILYLCIALMNHFHVLRKEVVGALGCGLFLIAMVTVQSTETLATVILPMLFMFVFGSYVYLAQDESTVGRSGLWAMIGLIIIQFFPAVFDAVESEFPLIYGPDLSTALLLAVYLISLPTFILWLGRIIQVYMPRLPDLSYGVYLFGWPVQQGIIYYFQEMLGLSISPLLLFGVSAVVSLLVAAVSWYGLEKHLLKTKNWYCLTVEKSKKAIAQWRQNKQA